MSNMIDAATHHESCARSRGRDWDGLQSWFLLSLRALGGQFSSVRSQLAEPGSAAGKPTSAVSILKPLKGLDPEAWESFCSHCEQDYPQFQLIFGVSDAADPAVDVVGKLQAKYPALAIELIVCERILGTNIKVSNLAQMLPAARHELLLVNDSDIRVPPDYLRQVVAPLADASVGLVTSLYRGIAGPTLGSRLEALGISTDFVPGVLSARFLEKGLRFGLGSTLAFRRRDLEPSAVSKRCWTIWPTTMNSAPHRRRRKAS